MFTALDEKTSGPETFDGPTGKMLTSDVFDWFVLNLIKSITQIVEEAEKDSSTEQKHVYRMLTNEFSSIFREIQQRCCFLPHFKINQKTNISN